MINKLAGMLGFAVLAAGCAGCAEREPAAAVSRGRPVVYTACYPMHYLAARLAGDAAEVVCPLSDGADPVGWMPSNDQIRNFQRADLIVINGASLEKWMEKVALPASRVVDTTRTLAPDFLTLKTDVTHSHGPGGDHTHKGIDPYTWMDPAFAKNQAAEIARALSRRMPAQAPVIEQRLAEVQRELDALHGRYVALTARLGGQHILAARPVFNYLKQRYQWKLSSLDLDPSARPDDKAVEYIQSLLEGWPTRIILWNAEPVPETARLFADRFNLRNVVFKPCAMRDESDRLAGNDYLVIMGENIDRLEKAIP